MSLEVPEVLLKYGVYPKLLGDKGNKSVIDRLVENGFDPTHRFDNGSTLLHQYFRDFKRHSTDTIYFHFLLENVEVNATDESGATALFYAL